MADKPKAQPSQPALANLLSGLGNRIASLVEDPSSAFQQPVAQTRITRTPVYQGSNMGEAAGQYYPASGRIFIKPEYLREEGWSPIPHESAHAIFNKGGAPFADQLAGQVPTNVKWKIQEDPQLYPPKANDADTARYNQMMANEGLGYSIGLPWATPYVEKVASKLDPTLAAQLLRLHHNAVAVYNLQNPPVAAVSK